jgi:hypothetical protein
MYENQWIRDITGAVELLSNMWERMQHVQLHQGSNDRLIWKWSPSQNQGSPCSQVLRMPNTARHQLQNNGQCALCSQVAETIAHLLLFCSYSREVWFRILLSLPGSLSSLRQVTWNPPTGGSLDASCCTKIIAKALILLSSLHAV